MPDIFDQIAAQPPAAQGGDIFDQVATQQPKGDIFDQVAASTGSGSSANKSIFLSPSERTGSKMVADPNDVGADVRLGNMVPQSAVPALTWIQKNVNERANGMASAGVEVGRALGRATLGVGSDKDIAALPGGQTALGVTGGVGSVVGGAIADPRNWPFLASGAARPLLQRVISGGFGAMMGNQAIDTAKDLHDNWDKYTPEQRAEKITQAGLTAMMSAGALTHSAFGGETAEVTPNRTGLRLRGTDAPSASGNVGDVFDRIAPSPSTDTTAAQPVTQPAAPPVFQGEAPDRIAELLRNESGTLDAGRVAQALPNFLTEDLRPKAESAKNWVSRAKDESLALFAPRVGVPEEALNDVMDAMGTREKSLAEMDLRGADARDMFDRMPESQQIDFLDKFKRGEDQPTPELNDLADYYHTAGDEDYKAVISTQLADPTWKKMSPAQQDTFIEGLKSGAINEDTPGLSKLADGLLNYKENHLRSFWETLPGEQAAPGTAGLGRAPLEGTKGFFRQATLPDVSTGIESGGKLVTPNPQKLFEMGRADTMKYVTTQRMISRLRQNGFMQFLPRGERMPDGFADLKDNVAKVQFPAKSGEGMVSPGKWIIEKNTGRILNNFLGRDSIRESAIGGGLLKLKNAYTGIELSVNSFHWVNEALAAVDTNIGVGLRKIARGDVLSGGKDVLTSIASPFTTSRLGGSAIRYLKDPESFLKTTRGADFISKVPEARQAIDDLFSAGGKLKMHSDFRTSFVESFKKAAKNNNPIGALLRTPGAAAELVAKPLFDSFIPRLKVGAFLKDYGQLLQERAGDLADGRVSRNKLARQSWDRVEHIFGELNWSKLFLDPNLKTSLQFGLRSATWQYGNAAELVNATTGLRHLAKGKLDADTAWGLGTVVRTAVMGALATRIITGKWPTQLTDYFYPPTGGVDRRGKPNRMAMPGYLNTDYRLVTQPTATLRGALSSPVTRTYDVATNRDWRGAEIYDPTASTISKAADVAGYMTPKPFSLTNYTRAMESSGSKWQGVRGGLGFNNAPYDLDSTKAEILARQLVTDKIPASRTQAQANSSQAVGQLTAEARNQDANYQRDLINAVKGEKITQRQALNIAGNSKRSYLQGLVSHLGVEDTLRIWEQATPQERAEIRPLLLEKATGPSFDNLPPRRQRELAVQIRSAIASTKAQKLTLQGTK